MTPLHLLYQARWAVRNDPALGLVMVIIFCAMFAYWQTRRDFLRRILRLPIEAMVYISMEDRP